MSENKRVTIPFLQTVLAPIVNLIHANKTEVENQFDSKVNMPNNEGQIDYGTAGQFAVSDGKGGITWKTLVKAEEVSY